MRRPSVSAAAPDLLVVGLQRSRNLEMHDGVDVGPVDSHAERVGRADDPRRAFRERVLDAMPLLFVESGVIREGLLTGRPQCRRSALRAFARRGVDQ